MRIRSVITIISLLSGCAVGEDVGDPVALEFGGDDLSVAEVVIEVASEDGEPLPALGVWVDSDMGDSFAADCMNNACESYVADVEAFHRVTAYASVCGSLYDATLTMPGTPAVHITIVAKCDGIPET